MSINEIVGSLENQLDTGAETVDYIQLSEWTSVVNRTLSLVLGIICVLIVIFLPFIVILEITYIVVPSVKTTVDKFTVKDSGAAVTILNFTFKDAKRAMHDAYCFGDGQGMKNPLVLYLKYKVWAIIVATLIVGLVVGGGALIPDFISNIFSGVIEFIASRFTTH